VKDEPDDYIVRFMEPPTGSLATLGADARLVATGVFAAMRPERLVLGGLVVLILLLSGSLGDASSSTSMPPIGAIATDPTLSDLFREHVEEFERPHGWVTSDVDGFEVQAAFATADPEVRTIVERLRRRGPFESFTGALRGGLGQLATGVVRLEPTAALDARPRFSRSLRLGVPAADLRVRGGHRSPRRRAVRSRPGRSHVRGRPLGGP
jgi:hypothetical protein